MPGNARVDIGARWAHGAGAAVAVTPLVYPPAGYGATGWRARMDGVSPWRWRWPCQDDRVDIVRTGTDEDALITADEEAERRGDPRYSGAEETLDRVQRTRLSALQAISRILVGEDVSASDLIDAAAYVVTGERVPPPPEHVYRAVREREGY